MITDGIEPIAHVWLDRLRNHRGLTLTTIRAYAAALRSLTTWSASKDGGNRETIVYLDKDDIGRWMDHLTRAGRDNQTRRTYIGTVSQFYLFCIRQGLITTDPTCDIDRPRGRRRLPRPIPDTELSKVFQLTTDVHMRAMLSLGAFAGLRALEVAGLDWRDIEMDDEGRPDHLTVMHGKGGHERVVDISDDLADALLALPARTGPVIPRLDGRAGPNAAVVISHRASGHLAGHGVHRGFHSLRHRFCTVAYSLSRDLRAVQEAAGHADPSTTAKYAAVSRAHVGRVTRAAGRLQAGPGSRARKATGPDRAA
jgi:integrase/recombinase XerC